MTKTMTLAGAALFAASTVASGALFCDGDTTNTVTWFVGQDPAPIHAIGFDTGVECFATGAELAFVKANFTGIKGRAHAGFTLYTGDDAAFIVDNL